MNEFTVVIGNFPRAVGVYHDVWVYALTADTVRVETAAWSALREWCEDIGDAPPSEMEPYDLVGVYEGHITLVGP